MEDAEICSHNVQYNFFIIQMPIMQKKRKNQIKVRNNPDV